VGGLVSALRPTLASRSGLWLGSRSPDGDAPEGLFVDPEAVEGRAELALPAAIHEAYYDGFCNSVLWPALHGMMSRVRYDDEAWWAYLEANEHFALAALRLVAPRGVIWIHDYHLMVLGSALRRRGFQGKLGFFLHVPFPPLEVLETLPRHAELLQGLAACDLVGFHTERYARNFVESAEALAGGTRGAVVGAFPIGIDADAFAPSPDPEPAEDVEALGLRGRRLLLGVDRLDYTKGICERLVGYERMLLRFPEWRGKVVLVQVAVPSREVVPEYQEQRAKIEALVGRINGELGEADWVPVRYLYRSYGGEELARLYRAASVALVTPLRDGMNLVAKEFIAAQSEEDPGVLVLSRFAGAAVELDRAVLTNPLHADGLAADIDLALRMELPERRRRHAHLLAKVRGNTAADWADRFLGALEALRRAGSPPAHEDGVWSAGAARSSPRAAPRPSPVQRYSSGNGARPSATDG
jgi:trehalose 6-phosphate synthase